MNEWRIIKKFLKAMAKDYDYPFDIKDCRKDAIWSNFLYRLKKKLENKS